jgi:16S rRNA (uracil1498-N3)-methyltransferase
MRSAADAAPSFVYLPELGRLHGTVALEGDEARYLAKVVRARAGEKVTATDGEGLLATLVVVESRPEVVVEVTGTERVPAPPASRLLCGAPEGDRGDWMVEKLAELGVTELLPVDGVRSRWPEPLRADRWERLAVAALRQSRSAWRMRIGPVLGLRAAVEGLGSGERWLADPAGAPVGSLAGGPGTAFTGAVGPSSGFSDEERNLLQEHGFVLAGLAPARLRTETAALAIAAHWAARRAQVGGPA